MNKLKHIYQELGYNFPLLLAFLLPFGINISIIIMMWVVCMFLFDDVKTVFKTAFQNKWTYILIGFFLLHVVGYFFSVNKHEALAMIERKLGFLALPILIYGSRYLELNVKKIVISFVSGCFFVMTICLFRAFYLLLFENINAFFYDEFSYFMHPSYFAMYLIFTELVIILYYKEWLSHLKNLHFKIGLMSFVLIVGIFLCSSKLGLISALLLLPTTVIVLLYNKGYKKGIIALLLGLMIAIPVSFKLFPRPYNRLKVAFEVSTSNQEINKAETDGTAVRILIWKESMKIIKDNFWFGVTPGDENDVLCKAYTDNGLTGALEKQLNTHNQYLQTFIGTGILGFILVCIMTLGAMLVGFIQKNYLLVLFSALAILNFLVESMLQAQAGFLFFVFFLALLTQYNLSRFSKTL